LRKALQSADLAAGGLDDHEGLCVEGKTGVGDLPHPVEKPFAIMAAAWSVLGHFTFQYQN